MNETSHQRLMKLSATSRIATVDASELALESTAGAEREHALPLSDMLELGLEALLNQFRRK